MYVSPSVKRATHTEHREEREREAEEEIRRQGGKREAQVTTKKSAQPRLRLKHKTKGNACKTNTDRIIKIKPQYNTSRVVIATYKN